MLGNKEKLTKTKKEMQGRREIQEGKGKMINATQKKNQAL